MEVAVQLAFNTLIAGAIYALVTLGFNLIYGTARFFDLGYGAVVTIGGYSVYLAYALWGLPLDMSIVFGVLISAAVGFLIEKSVYRKLRSDKASSTVLLVASLGILTMGQAMVALLFDSQFHAIAATGEGEHVFGIFGGTITQTQLGILFASIAIMGLLGWLLAFTRFGKAVRAIADDEEAANIVGINTEQIIGRVFLIGSAIGGLAGIAAGFDTGLQPSIGFSLLLKGVIAAIIGGVGNVYGGFIGAFLLAAIENLGAWQFSGGWKDAVAFSVLILFLLVRPQGILGRK